MSSVGIDVPGVVDIGPLPAPPRVDAARAPIAPRGLTVKDYVLDWGERAVIVVLYAGLVARLLAGIRSGGWASLLLLPSEGLVVAFMILRRRAVVTSRRPGDWLLAFAATCAPLLVARGGTPVVPPGVAAVILMIGLVVQLHAKLSLGRSIGCVPALRRLVTAGPYRFVRHPMYAGYLIADLGFLALNPNARNLVLYGLALALQVPRLLAEERLLVNDPEYRTYRETVRYRLLPGVF